MPINQAYMNEFFSKPHRKGSHVNFKKGVSMFLATKGQTPHKRGNTINFSKKRTNEAPLSIANLRKLFTHRRNTSPKKGNRIVSNASTNNTRRKILMTVNNKHFVKFYANNPKYIEINIPVPMRSSFRRSINAYHNKKAR